MTEPSNIDRTLARTIARVFGGSPRVNAFHDDAGTNSVDILRAEDRPQVGVTSWSTLGLNNAPLLKQGEEYGARVELVGACESAFEEFGNVLATAAFCIIKDQWFCAPGIIFPDVVRMYRPGSPMRHAMFLPPYLWKSLRTQEFGQRTVAWLLLVPISDAERKLADAQGPDRLESLFEEKQIDIFDIDRPSVV